jgi:selenophosphate synthase
LPENLAMSRLLRGDVDDPTKAVLFDPQTSGGLLAGISAGQATECLRDLHSAGYEHAVAIGRVRRAGADDQGGAIYMAGTISDVVSNGTVSSAMAEVSGVAPAEA